MAEEMKTVLVAESSPFKAGFDEAAAVVKKHLTTVNAMHQAAKAGAEIELRALREEIKGRRELADELRQNQSLRVEALKVAKQQGVSTREAMELLQRRIRLERQLADTQAQQRGPTGPVNLADARGANLAMLDRMRVQAAATKREMDNLGRGTQNAAMGFLEVSRAVEDAQYGFRGVINNVPGMVMAFGGSMGLAGGISLAVVALYNLGKAYTAWLESIDGSKAVLAHAEAWEKVYQAERKAIQEGRDAADLAADMEVLRRSLGNMGSTGVDTTRTRQGENALQARQQEIEVLRQLEDAERELAAVKGEEVANARAKEIERMREEMVMRKELAKVAQEELARLKERKGQEVASIEGRGVQIGADLEAAREELARYRANLEGTLAALEETNAAEAGNLRQNKRIYEEKVKLLEEEVKKLEEMRTVYDEQTAAAKAAAAAEIAAQEARIDGNAQKREQLKRELEMQQRLLQLEAERTRVEKEKAERNRLAQSLEDLRDRADKTARKMKEEKERERDQLKGRAGFLIENKALQLELQGKKELADALRREAQMRQDAVELAKELGITEQRALQLLRERQRMIDEIDRKEKGGLAEDGEEGSKIRRYRGNVQSRTAGAFLNSELQRRAREREMTPRQPQRTRAEELAERQVTLMEEQVKIWAGLQSK